MNKISPSRREFLYAAGLAALGSTLAAQDATFSTDVNVVSVFATVHRKSGDIVSNLTKDDFLLSEDNRPQTIKYFSRESDLPLTLGLLVDTSMSQRRLIGEERSASYRFFDHVLREDRDLAFLIHFDFDSELLQDLTSSRKQLEKGLEMLELPQRQMSQRQGGGGRGGNWPGAGGSSTRGGGTVLYDAVLLASDELMRKQKGRKALIVLTDGVDHGSRVPLTQAIEAAQRADTLVYSVLFEDKEGNRQPLFSPGGMGGGRRGGMGGGGGRPRVQMQDEDGKKVLQKLSRETGGGFFEVSKKMSIEQIYARIQDELRNQYSLGFVPDSKSDGFRRITLATRQKDLLVQTRDGYYQELP